MKEGSIGEETISSIKGSQQGSITRKFGNNAIHETTIRHTSLEALVKTICAKIFRAYRGLYNLAMLLLTNRKTNYRYSSLPNQRIETNGKKTRCHVEQNKMEIMVL